MVKICGRHQAQIGVIAVLLTAILLAVGISVTTRVANQVVQETSRMESGQILNQAESLIDAPVLEGELPNTALSRTIDASSANDAIYLQAGEAIEVSLWQTQQSGTSPANAIIRWGFRENATQSNYDLCTSEAALLLTYVDVAGGENYYLPVIHNGCSSVYKDYHVAEEATNTRYISQFPLSTWPATRPAFAAGTQERPNLLRIRALYAGTYVEFPGLTVTLRTASANEVGSEVRVEEQNQTSETAPFTNDFAIFAGNSEVCQAVDGETNCGDMY